MSNTEVIKVILKWFLIILVLLAIALLVQLVVAGKRSQNGVAPGLVNGQLAPCPNKPNCVSSEAGTDPELVIEPIGVSGEGGMKELTAAIESMGGVITLSDGNYIATEFKSSVFGFVDDVEIRLDESTGKIHIRSASREGYGDLGANRNRVEALRAVLGG